MKFEYKTHILCHMDTRNYTANNGKTGGFKKGETYYVGLRKHPLFGYCYYELKEDGHSTTGYYIQKDVELFQEISNSVHFILS